MNLGPPSSCFFFNSGPKKALSLLLDVKSDQQTHKKKMTPPIMASIARKSSNNIPITFFQMLLAGRRTHNFLKPSPFQAFFCSQAACGRSF
jgi:hypothetical protein